MTAPRTRATTPPDPRTDAAPPAPRTDAASPDLQTGAASPGPRIDAASPDLQTGAASPGPRIDAAPPDLQTGATPPDPQTRATPPDPRTTTAPLDSQTGAASPGPRIDAASPDLQTRATSPGSQTTAAPPHPQTRATPPDPRTTARPVRITGPRVACLVTHLGATDVGQHELLTGEFWAEVERLGTPLVEEVEDEPGHRAVTFLWRGDRATRQVLLLGNRIIDRENLAGSLLEHIPGTDVWHLGLRLRSDHVGSYRMAADVSAEEPPKDPDELQQRLRSLSGHAAPDPLNAHVMPTRWHPADSSAFALPDSPAQPWAGRHGTVPAGRVERHRVTATALGGDRDVWVYLPPGHGQGDTSAAAGSGGSAAAGSGGADPLPLLVLCDGDMWFGRLELGHTLDALIADGALPPLAVLSPDAVDRHTRWSELGGRHEFVAFLTDELLPWAAGRWPLTTDPGRTVVAGQSLGALTALYAAHLRPDRFGNVLAQSASLWWRPGLPPGVPKSAVAGIPWVIDLFAEAGPRPLTIHLDVGLHEGLMVDHSRVVYDALRSAGYRMTFNEYNGGHDYACWHSALADGLVRLLGPEPR